MELEFPLFEPYIEPKLKKGKLKQARSIADRLAKLEEKNRKYKEQVKAEKQKLKKQRLASEKRLKEKSINIYGRLIYKLLGPHIEVQLESLKLLIAEASYQLRTETPTTTLEEQKHFEEIGRMLIKRADGDISMEAYKKFLNKYVLQIRYLAQKYRQDLEKQLQEKEVPNEY